MMQKMHIRKSGS